MAHLQILATHTQFCINKFVCVITKEVWPSGFIEYETFINKTKHKNLKNLIRLVKFFQITVLDTVSAAKIIQLHIVTVVNCD